MRNLWDRRRQPSPEHAYRRGWRNVGRAEPIPIRRTVAFDGARAGLLRRRQVDGNTEPLRDDRSVALVHGHVSTMVVSRPAASSSISLGTASGSNKSSRSPSSMA
jgi:hypothetical protein